MAIRKLGKPGRPALAESERKTVNFTFRSRPELREKLAAAAVQSGRSISEEIESRLAQSFFAQEIIDQVVSQTIKATFEYVDRKRDEEEAERRKLRPFSDLFTKSDEEGKS
jgi:hypothetical protein